MNGVHNYAHSQFQTSVTIGHFGITNGKTEMLVGYAIQHLPY